MREDKIRFVINPIAGFRRDKSDIINLIHALFRDDGFEIAMTAAPGDATLLAREAAAQNYKAVIAIGGDGTVNEVASGLVGTNTALGIIPRGSGNGLARGLALPIAPKAALEVVQHGARKTIDVGSAGHRFFFAVTGVGFDARVGMKFNHASWRGPVPYFMIAAREFVSYHPEMLRVKLDEQQLELAPFTLTIANTQQYGNGAVIAPHAQPDDGVLDMCIVAPLTLWSVMAHGPKLFNGTIDRAPFMRYRHVTSLEIEKDGPILFHVDGEAQTCNERLKISILPHALHVLTPVTSSTNSSHAH